MLEPGADVFTVQMRLGHESPKTTRRYLDLSPQFLAGAITPMRPLIW